jgi:hypothetical protein
VFIDRISGSCDPTETAAEMSIGEQDSVLGDPTHVEIWDAMPIGNSDKESKESGTD